MTTTVRIVLRTEVPEEIAADVITRFERAAEPLIRAKGVIARRTMLNARTIEWDVQGNGRQTSARKVI